MYKKFKDLMIHIIVYTYYNYEYNFIRHNYFSVELMYHNTYFNHK